MVTHPVYVRRSNYRGSDPKKRQKANQENRDAALIESYVNQLILEQKEAVKSYGWMEISQGTGIPYDTVARLGYSIDGGSNGFTATRPGLGTEEITRALRGEKV